MVPGTKPPWRTPWCPSRSRNINCRDDVLKMGHWLRRPCNIKVVEHWTAGVTKWLDRPAKQTCALWASEMSSLQRMRSPPYKCSRNKPMITLTSICRHVSSFMHSAIVSIYHPNLARSASTLLTLQRKRHLLRCTLLRISLCLHSPREDHCLHSLFTTKLLIFMTLSIEKLQWNHSVT